MKRSALRRPPQDAKLTVRVFRPKKCGGCGCQFTPSRPMQKACTPVCAVVVGRAVRERQERREDAAKRIGLRTRSDWIKLAQIECNKYIRLRDAGKACICCGKFPQSESLTGGEWDAGHYRSRGAAPELRFDERNIHAQLKKCNRRAWDVASYRANLIARIGLAEVEALEGPHDPVKWTIAELIAVRDGFLAKVRALILEAK